MSKTYCKHCINTCKTIGVKNDCKKYKTEDMAEIRKNYLQNKDKIAYFDYGIEIDHNDNIVKFKEI